MKIVVADLILHPQQDQDGTGHPDGQTRNIDKGKTLILP
jgi:hypothetical protein